MSFNKILQENFDKNRKTSEVCNNTKFIIGFLNGQISDEIMQQVIQIAEKTFSLCGTQVAEKEIIALAEGLGVLDKKKRELIKKEVTEYSEAA